MRKIYALLAGFILSLAGFNSANARNVSPDVANFTVTIDAPNNNAFFTNTSSIGSEPGIRRAYWNFGDGIIQMTGPLANTQHHYQVAGTYNVCLRIYRYGTNIGDSVLTAYVCKTLVIQATCNAEFLTLSVAANSLLKYFVAQPSHNQNKKPVRICWQFGDGHDTCYNYPTNYTGVYGASHLYAYPGNYNVCVSILYDGGCQAYKCHQVQAGNPDTCGADFERIQSTGANPLLAYFKALPQHNNNRKPSQVCWIFGDGRDTCINYTETFTGQYVVSHLYLQPGQYNVCVNIHYYGGCEANKCKSIQISRPDTCGADFERIASNANDPQLAYYKALPQHNNNRKPSQVCWIFGDGRDTCINYTETYTGLYIVSHLYLHPGSYQVCVNIHYYGGCEANKCKPIQVGRPDTCGADFERIQSTNTNPLLAYYKALPQHNNNRKPSRVCWIFGDGSDSCINYPETYTGLYVISHTYLHPGLYQVCVNIRYYGGCEANKCKPIQIARPDTCGADFERIQSAGTNPLLAYYKALPQHNNNRKPSRVCWTFGEGGRGDTCINYSETYTGQYVISHSYLHPGLYQVCVNIRYYGGCEASKCKPIQVGRPDTCGADFEKIQSGTTNPLRAYYLALPQHNNNRKPSRVCWTFGEAGRGDTCINYTETYTGQYAVVHEYLHPGLYQVCVHIQYYGGCEANKCKPIQISRPDTCGADFEKIQSGNTNPLRAYYLALPQHNNNRKPSRVCWTFGEAGRGDTCINYTETYTGQYAVVHEYLHPGLYQVCVHIQYYGGCEANKCKPIQIGRPDTCGADFERIQSPTSLYTYFKALPQHNNNRKPSRVCWHFGDGQPDTCINYTETYTGLYVVSHHYMHSGLYEVCVHIQYYGGCEASKCKPIQVGVPDSCHADFERIPSPNADPRRAYFRALPWNSNNNKPSRICWSFGDGSDTCINYTTTYTGQYVVAHDYQHTGLYQVCVNILYFGGCEAHKCNPVQIGNPDTCGADFERIQSPTSLNTYFKALPQHNNNRKPARVCWHFGDGQPDTCINYPETFTGLYVVSHHYAQPGQYEVCVHITYYGGCEASKCKPVQIGVPDICGADFERISPEPTSLSVYLKALPQHNNNRKPSRVCWQFGDGHDTCINYAESFTGLYVVFHHYAHPGQYQVCVHITYYGGCEATKCKPILVGVIPDTCGADFERITSGGTNPLLAYYKALPQHNNNRKPSQVCWRFGDGHDTCINYTETYTGQYVVSHLYAHAGQYEVCVQITYFGGCVATKCKLVPITGGNQPILVLSPNPVINIVHVDFFSTHTEQINIKIFNSTGFPVMSFVRNVTAGQNSWTNDLSSLAPGVYSYTVQSPTQLASAAFIKL